MGYDIILIDGITCDSYMEMMYDETNPSRKTLLELQTKSANLIADGKSALLCITSETKKQIEKKHYNRDIPISLSCLLSSCEEYFEGARQ